MIVVNTMSDRFRNMKLKLLNFLKMKRFSCFTLVMLAEFQELCTSVLPHNLLNLDHQLLASYW